MRPSLAALPLALLLWACDESSGQGSGGSAGQASGGSAGSTGGAPGGGGAGLGGMGGGGGGGATDAGSCEPAPKLLAPGEALTSGADQGGGACLGVSVTQFLAKIHAAHPELADITEIYSPSVMYDGSFVYPYREPDGSFAFVLKRGGGDCPAGCTENEYWYFEADASCAPKDAGHFKPTWGQGCVNVEGQARWGRPPVPDPASVCGADLAPKDISGTHQVWACGTRVPCSLAKPPGETFSGWVKLVIVQDGVDPTKGTVTFSGTGYATLDGLALQATFLRQRFSVTFHQDNLPATCPKSLDVSAGYDFEGFGQSALTVDEVDTPDCSSPGDYCKGGVFAKLFPAPP